MLIRFEQQILQELEGELEGPVLRVRTGLESKGPAEDTPSDPGRFKIAIKPGASY
jgi:hypothetical protein